MCRCSRAWMCFSGMTQICLQNLLLQSRETTFSAWAGEVEESIKGGVMMMTHLTVEWLLNKTVFLLTFHTSAAPTGSRGVSSLCWGGGEEPLQRSCRVCCWGFFFCFVSFFTVFPSLRVLCVFCQDEGGLLTLKCGLLHLQEERVKREVNCGGLSLVVPHQEAPQLSGTSSDDWIALTQLSYCLPLASIHLLNSFIKRMSVFARFDFWQ